MGYPDAEYPNGAPNLHTVFYAHTLSLNGNTIGSFGKYSTSSSRTNERIREIKNSTGPEVVEIVWGGTEITVELSRVEIYSSNLFQAMGFQIFTLEDLNQPINIIEMQRAPNGSVRTITFEDCVASSWSKDLDTSTAHIMESMSFDVRHISATIT